MLNIKDGTTSKEGLQTHESDQQRPAGRLRDKNCCLLVKEATEAERLFLRSSAQD